MAKQTLINQAANKVAPAGSDLYYATRFVALDKREALISLHYLIDLLMSVPQDCSEPEIAEAKLNWWQEELNKTYDGSPQHPATQLIAPSIEKFDLAKEYFDEIITGVRMDVQSGRYANYGDLSLYLHRTGSMPWLLSAIICQFSNHMTTKFAHHLGEAIRYLSLIRNTPKLLMQGYFYIPEADLALGELSYQDFNNPVTPEKLEKQFSYQLSRISKTLDTAIDNLSPEDRQQQKPLLTLHRLATYSINHIKKHNYALLESPIEMTPLKKTWIAWRTH